MCRRRPRRRGAHSAPVPARAQAGLLIDGTLDAVITQHQQATVLNCVRIFTNLRDGREPLTGVDPVGIHIVLRENLP